MIVFYAMQSEFRILVCVCVCVCVFVCEREMMVVVWHRNRLAVGCHVPASAGRGARTGDLRFEKKVGLFSFHEGWGLGKWCGWWHV